MIRLCNWFHFHIAVKHHQSTLETTDCNRIEQMITSNITR